MTVWNDRRITELLLETKAYMDLDEPVILTSGELGIYYINTEKLVQDNGKFNEFGDNSKSMIEHAINMMDEHRTFKEVIEIVSKRVSLLFPNLGKGYAISGGQRRDWLFSGPVARELGLPHISLYKPEVSKPEKVELLSSGGEVEYNPDLSNFYVIHVADLMTKGSSAYSIDGRKELGWIPMLRNRGATINDLVNIVTRLQGGEETLTKIGIDSHAFVAIDTNFISQHSKNRDTAIAYIKNPVEWSDNYIREKGIASFVKTFDPQGGKLDRARKFLNVYKNVLEESGQRQKIEEAVQQAYGRPIDQIIGR